MRKDQLVKALLSVASANQAKPKATKKSTVAIRRSGTPKANVAARRVGQAPSHKASNPRILKHLNQVQTKLRHTKNLSSTVDGKPNRHLKDRVIVMVRDPYWLHVYWEISRQSVERIQAAMSQSWHTAKPLLRLLEVGDTGLTGGAERVARDIPIHGGVSNWYLHVENPPNTYRVEIGYIAADGKFFSLARSNVVTTPTPGSSDALDENWSDVAQNFDKIYAMSGGYAPDNNSTELQELFEERLRRPMGTPMGARYAAGLEMLLPPAEELEFAVDAEMIIYGSTRPDARVTLKGEPVRLRPDGTFTVRLSMPNQRQVIPVVASAKTGGEQRTIVLAVERNTKVMEPVGTDPSE
jgi:hypothetical protein